MYQCEFFGIDHLTHIKHTCIRVNLRYLVSFKTSCSDRNLWLAGRITTTKHITFNCTAVKCRSCRTDNISQTTATIEISIDNTVRQRGCHVVGLSCWERWIFYIEATTGCTGWPNEELIVKVTGYTTVSQIVLSSVTCIITLPWREIDFVSTLVLCSHTVVWDTAIAGTKVVVEGTSCGSGGNSLSRLHITKLRSTAIGTHMAIDDINRDITRYRLTGIHATTIEVFNISIVYLPPHVTINLLLCSTSCFLKSSTADITLSIVCFYFCIRPIGSRKIETIKVTARDRNRNVRRKFVTITVCTITEILEPCITA